MFSSSPQGFEPRVGPQVIEHRVRLEKYHHAKAFVEEAIVDCFERSEHVAPGSKFKPCGLSILFKNRRATRRALRYVLPCETEVLPVAVAYSRGGLGGLWAA